MPQIEPEQVDVGAAFEPDRGFDWGPEQDSGAMPKRRRFKRRGGRGGAVAAAVADPTAGPELIYEPSPDADLDPARPRVMVGRGSLIAIVVLAAVCGLTAFKVLTTDTASLDTGTESAPVDAPLAVPPSDGVAPPADPVAVPDATSKPATPKKQGAKPPAAVPGNAVADDGGLETLADAVAEAGTAPAAAASDTGSAQVPASDADTPVVTATAAQSSANPFARPE
jgi:hypothetical protein